MYDQIDVLLNLLVIVRECDGKIDVTERYHGVFKCVLDAII